MENMSNKIVSVIIVTCGANNYLELCLESLKNQAYSDLEIIIIDNSLSPGFTEKLSSSFPSLKVYSSPRNLFYSAALNTGIGLSKGEFVFCLNDDVVLERNFIKEVLKGFSGDGRIGMVSGKILRQNGQTIDSTGLFLNVCRVSSERGYGLKDTGQYNKSGYIFGVCGAAAFYRRKMLEDIKEGLQYFDEDLSFFYEDLDIAWRAKNLGWKAYYVPTAIAYHARGGTARQKKGTGRSFARFYISDELQFDLIKNRYLAVIKNETLLGFLLHLPFMLIYDAAVLGFLILFRPKVIPRLFGLPGFIKSALSKRMLAKGV
jgi:GT2 family glycosyltransferase